MSKISKAMAQAAAGAGGVLDYEVGSRMTTTQGGAIDNSYALPIDGTNYFIVLNSHGTQLYVHLLEVNPSTLAVTWHSKYDVGTSIDNRYGHGIAYNPYLGNWTVLRQYSGTFYAHTITRSGTTLTQSGNSQNVGSTNSGYYRGPNDNSSLWQVGTGGQFMHFSIDTSNEVRVRLIQSTTSNTYQTYSWSGRNIYGSRNNIFRIAPMIDSANYTQGWFFTRQYSNNVYLESLYYDAGWYSPGTISTLFNDSSTGTPNHGIAIDEKNVGTFGTGNYGLMTAWPWPNDNNYVGYKHFEVNTSPGSYFYSNTANSSTKDTNYTVDGFDAYDFTDGSSGNLIIGRGTYSGGSSYGYNLYQIAYNDSEGFTGPIELFRDTTDAPYVARGFGAYNSNADASLCVYQDIYASQWYARAFRGRRAA